MLGVVSGRRRMGKTYLLSALWWEQQQGFYFGGHRGDSRGESLRQFGAALHSPAGSPSPFSFASWDDAIFVLVRAGQAGQTLPGRTRQVPLSGEDRSRTAVTHPARSRSFPARGKLDATLALRLRDVSDGRPGWASTAPLRGLCAVLELIVRPFDYRESAQFWGLQDDPALAARVHAVLGGTPAYRRQFLAEDTQRAVWPGSTTGSPGPCCRR